jgi:ribosomal protein L37AE/L43A/DNA-directed RNA polymerase subunit RPC12/RpoP
MLLANNLLDVDNLVSNFIKDNESGINTLHKVHYKTNDPLSLRALCMELESELKTGCVTFINKNSSIDELGSYLFYIANAFCKKNAKTLSKKKINYMCPACEYVGKNTILGNSQVLSCAKCKAELNNTSDPKKILLFNTFYRHNKSGYRCSDCNRFIPHPLNNSNIITCPYFKCYYSGTYSDLKKMHHPSSHSNTISLDANIANSNSCMKDLLVSKETGALSKLENDSEFSLKISTLNEVIESQSNSILYSSSDFTIKHKLFTYQAFSNLISKYPNDMVDYLINNSRSGGFQHKIFQEYVRLLEASLPFVFKKNGKLYKVSSLLDDNMCVFDGISTFEAIVNDKNEIKNNTQEFYIGGRKAAYTKPYYMGKLLSVIDKKTNESLFDHVKEYSFSKIYLKNISPGSKVEVTHLRIPPHYQMGGMVYVNRIRKKIIEKTLTLLNKDLD